MSRGGNHTKNHTSGVKSQWLLLGEMADFRAGAGEKQDEPGASQSATKTAVTKIKAWALQPDRGIDLKRLPGTNCSKAGTIV